MPSSPARASRLPRHDETKFALLDTLQAADGTTAHITQRKSNGAITFSIFRVFDRDGEGDWTSYFGESQIEDFEAMLKLVKDRIVELRRDPKVMPRIQSTPTQHR